MTDDGMGGGDIERTQWWGFLQYHVAPQHPSLGIGVTVLDIGDGGSARTGVAMPSSTLQALAAAI